MNAKLNGIALGVSAVALLVASLGLSSTITQARQRDAGVQGDLLRSTEVIRVRVDDLERQNAELREALTTMRTRLETVESVHASSEDRLGPVTDRIAKLEESSAETSRAMLSFGRTRTATRQTVKKTDTEMEDEPDEEPKLEDYLRIDLDPINGLPGPHIIIEGANLHVRSGSGATDDFGGVLYGLGNVVIGYNEYDPTQLRARNGSHNLIVGSGHGYSSFGGFLAGYANEVIAPNSSVSGGTGNRAKGWASSISGGQGNRATAESSSVAGGSDNQAVTRYASVTGGTGNIASGWASSVTGGQRNRAIGDSSSVTGGADNRTLANASAIVGGMNETLDREGYSQAGSLLIPPSIDP